MGKKTILVGINAKYIHSNLAIRYLYHYCRQQAADLSIMEFSINDHFHHIMKALYQSGADIIGFSCYIWNIDLIYRLSSSLKKAKPDLTIILGGPEVSFDTCQILAEQAAVDYIIAGEGEQVLSDFLKYAEGSLPGSGKDSGKEPANIRGLTYRTDGRIIVNPPAEAIADLDTIPFPYEDLRLLDNKIIYYETSRGCPFSCQYCLSSTMAGVRYFSLDRVHRDIRYFAENRVKQVKLVDRTFNCDRKRCADIMQYIIGLKPETNFHLEIAADLIDEAFLEAAAAAPDGLFQFEIGVQSTNPETLREIRRSMDLSRISNNVKKLLSLGNAHLHLDLIAGLPFEGYESFKQSFNTVFALKPHMLQLGFLKLLKGSGLRERADRYETRYHESAPYEVISTKWLTYDEVLKLKDIEQLLESYYNSGRYENALAYLMDAYPKPAFGFFEDLSLYWHLNGYFGSAKSSQELYTLLYRFAEVFYRSKQAEVPMTFFNEYIKLDWMLHNRYGNMPDLFKRFEHGEIKEQLNQHIRLMIKTGAPFQAFEHMPFKDALKYIRYEVFRTDVTKPVPTLTDTVVFFVYPADGKSSSPLLFSIPLSALNA